MKKLKKILRISFLSLLAIIISFNIYSFISIKVLKQDLVKIFGYSYLEVISGSMEPTINIGDIIIIDTKDNDYKVNDIVTFKDVNGSFVTHKIIKETEKGFITKGDNNNTIDQDYLSKENIVGTYKFRMKYLGVIITSFKNPITLLTILIIGIIVCVLKNTDKDGMPLDISEDFKEFLDYKEKKNANKNAQIKRTKVPDESDILAHKKSASNKKTSAKKTTTKKVEEVRPTTKKTTTKKVEDKKTTAKKQTTKKVEEKKPAAKKTTTKKVEEKKPTVKKTATKKVEEVKPTAKKPTTKKVEEKKPAAKKTATKKVEEVKPTAKKTTTKKVEEKKTTTKKTTKNVKKK